MTDHQAVTILCNGFFMTKITWQFIQIIL